MGFWLKNSIKAVRCMAAVELISPRRVGNLKASTVCWRESARRVKLSGNQALVKDLIKNKIFGSSRPRLVRSSEGPRAQSGGQAKKPPISSQDFAWNCCSPFKCAQDNSPWSRAQMLHRRRVQLFSSQSYLSSHSLINNLIVCNNRVILLL